MSRECEKKRQNERTKRDDSSLYAVIISLRLLLTRVCEHVRFRASAYQAYFRSISMDLSIGSPVTFEACGPRSRTGRWASQVARLFPRCFEPTACSCPHPRAPAIELCTRPSSSCWCRPGNVSTCQTARTSPRASRSAPRCPR